MFSNAERRSQDANKELCFERIIRKVVKLFASTGSDVPVSERGAGFRAGTEVSSQSLSYTTATTPTEEGSASSDSKNRHFGPLVGGSGVG